MNGMQNIFRIKLIKLNIKTDAIFHRFFSTKSLKIEI